MVSTMEFNSSFCIDHFICCNEINIYHLDQLPGVGVVLLSTIHVYILYIYICIPCFTYCIYNLKKGKQIAFLSLVRGELCLRWELSFYLLYNIYMHTFYYLLYMYLLSITYYICIYTPTMYTTWKSSTNPMPLDARRLHPPPHLLPPPEEVPPWSKVWNHCPRRAVGGALCAGNDIVSWVSIQALLFLFLLKNIISWVSISTFFF